MQQVLPPPSGWHKELPVLIPSVTATTDTSQPDASRRLMLAAQQQQKITSSSSS
jgi:hypothetical protein